MVRLILSFFFFFNDTATTEIYTLSLHDALPIFLLMLGMGLVFQMPAVTYVLARIGLVTAGWMLRVWRGAVDRKSTPLNSSHSQISYAVFCLKKKKKSYQYSPRTSTNHVHRLSLH